MYYRAKAHKFQTLELTTQNKNGIMIFLNAISLVKLMTLLGSSNAYGSCNADLFKVVG